MSTTGRIVYLYIYIYMVFFRFSDTVWIIKVSSMSEFLELDSFMENMSREHGQVLFEQVILCENADISLLLQFSISSPTLLMVQLHWRYSSRFAFYRAEMLASFK